jgi:hypothetical protein
MKKSDSKQVHLPPEERIAILQQFRKSIDEKEQCSPAKQLQGILIKS